jgi:predicted GNAT family acetyltransferase
MTQRCVICVWVLRLLWAVLTPQESQGQAALSLVAVSDDYIKSQIAQLNDQLPSVYKIDLPDDQIAKMLDWDAEISKQSKEVQDLAKQYGLNMDDLGGDLVAAMDAKRPAGAESMRQAGVPGIKYFDAQSRGGQKADTRNFVVFPKNEGLLKIEEVNGQPVQGGLLRGDAFDVSRVDASDIFGAGAQKTVYKDPDSGGYIQVLTRPDQPASVTALEVPEAFRQQGIGGRLQEQALKDFPNMQGQVSSKSAARSAYKQGRRPVGQPDATLDDVLKMIDEDSSVNLVSPARQQEMSGSQSGLLDTDYRGSHSAPNAEVYGATLDDLTKIMPANVYAPEGKQLYGLGDRLVDSEWRIAALKTRGKPDAEIEVYRAVPKGVKDINSGDWVTTSKTYADQHGERTLDGDYEIIKRKVKARTLSSEGYPYEFGYNE